MKITFDKYLPTKIISYLLLICLAIAFYFAVLRWDDFVIVVSNILTPFRPFVYGFVVAYLLKGLVNRSEKSFLKKIKGPRLRRVISISIAMILFFAILTALIIAVMPQVTDSALKLANNFSTYLATVGTMFDEIVATHEIDELYVVQMQEGLKDFEKTATTYVKGIFPLLIEFITTSASKLSSFIIGLFIAVYLLFSKEALCGQLKKFLTANMKEENKNNLLEIAKISDKTFSKFITGKIVDSLIIGILCFIAMSVLKLDYALLISVVVGVTNIIPFFGPFIGAIPSIIILFMVDPMQALKFSIMILILQQLDGNVIGPKILGDSLGLPLIWIMFAILIGGGLFGFLGMVLGVPTFAVVYSLIGLNTKRKLEAKNLPTETSKYI